MMSKRTRRRKRLRDTLNLHRFALSTEAFEGRPCLAGGIFLQGTAFVDANNNSVLYAGQWYLANATIKLFDSTGTTQLGQATSDAFGQYLFKDGNGPVFNDNLPAGTYQLLEVPPKETLCPKDRAPETLVHPPLTLRHRLTRFGIVTH